MYLSKLDILGFKSFAQKTTFTFSEGLSALVGPNGCGKTNIVDAIRWVLGEKKASVLRSDVMENVIFNGTKHRKPLGMAEVTLTIENNKNILPIEYNEVNITRRLYRSGESEYLLNKTKCRLRDILDLFLDTGLGSDSYSVIELKMVEAILSGRFDDRRSLFEEAAGIKKYKIRRKETARKLDDVRSDLERVRDIVEEVRKNVASLSRQAAKTRRYNNLMEELRENEVKMMQYEFSNFQTSFESASAELNVFNQQKIKYEFELANDEKNISELKNKIHNLSKELQGAQENEKSINTQLSFAKEKLAAKNAKLNSFDTTKSILMNQIEENNQRIIKIETQINENNLKLESLKSNLSEAEKLLAMNIAERDDADNILKNIRTRSGSANEDVLELQNKYNSANRIIERNNSRKTQIENKILNSEKEANSLQLQKQELLQDINSLRARFAEFEIDLQNAEENFNIEQERRNSLQNNLAQLRDILSDKKNILSSRKASLAFLESLTDTGETGKYLLKNDSWSSDSEIITLGEAVGVDEEYRIAAEAALAEYSHAFVVDKQEDAQNAIDILKKNNKGKAAFIIKELIPEIAPPTEIQDDNCIGYLSEMARIDDKLRYALRAALGSTVFVNDKSAALNIIENHNSFRAVTLDGEIYESGGYRKGGSLSGKEGQIIGKKERATQLMNEISTISNDIEQTEYELEAVREEMNSIDINALKNNLKKIEAEINSYEHKINQTELKETAIDDKIKLLTSSKSGFQIEIEEINNENQKFTSQIDNLTDEINKAKEIYQTFINELSKAEEELRLKETIAKNQEIDKVNISAEIRNTANDIKNLSSELENLNIRIQAKREELETGEVGKDKLNDEINSLQNELAVLSEKKDEIANKVEYLQSEKDSIQEQFEQYSDSLNYKRKEADKIKEKIHEKEITISELKVKLENINSKANEDYHVDFHTLEFIPESDFIIDDAKHEIFEIKDKLSKLGNVNFMALEEFEQQSSRLEFYDKQMADLTESEKILNETMEEINSTAERNFLDTFSKIRDNFKNLFKTLFGSEAESDLKLVMEDNPLESDIEIIAKPPFKKPHSIEMLSGGEKTLTAIALLFGIYLVKPSPFCILDEVDAPLDDSNIGKFINLIRDFSNNTQFLIVSHNKGTMEAADTLYGVTMLEDGVSKVVSVKVDENNDKIAVS